MYIRIYSSLQHVHKRITHKRVCAHVSELRAPVPLESHAIGAVVVEHQFDEWRWHESSTAREVRVCTRWARRRWELQSKMNHLVRGRGRTRLRRRNAIVGARDDRVELLLGARPRVEAHHTERRLHRVIGENFVATVLVQVSYSKLGPVNGMSTSMSASASICTV